MLGSSEREESSQATRPPSTASKPAGVTIFDDQHSNVTWTYDASKQLGARLGPSHWSGHYFEGNNLYVYIHGKEDPEGDWWKTQSDYKKAHGKGGVLVNCHFDSFVYCSYPASRLTDS